jgi:hypothetical protein
VYLDFAAAKHGSVRGRSDRLLLDAPPVRDHPRKRADRG